MDVLGRHFVRRNPHVATRVVDTASPFGRTGTLRLEDLGLLPAVVAESALGDELVARYLAPLDSLGAFGRAVAATVACHIDCGLNLEATARTLRLHRNTLKHRLRRYNALTGADLRSIETTFQIWWALQRRAMTR